MEDSAGVGNGPADAKGGAGSEKADAEIDRRLGDDAHPGDALDDPSGTAIA